MTLHHRSFYDPKHARVFAALTPIRRGEADALRASLQKMPGGKRPIIGESRRGGDSPLNLAVHHYARLLVISEFAYNGPPQQPAVLKSAYLLFSACFDMMDVDTYLRLLADHLGDTANEVWDHCVGYGRNKDDLPRYLKHNAITPAILHAQYPEATVERVRRALRQREAVVNFVVHHQLDDGPKALREAWKELVKTLGPRT